jgi:hypothetical protein
MKTTLRVLAVALAAPFALATAQSGNEQAAASCCKPSAAKPQAEVKDSASGTVAAWSLVPQIQVQNFRPADQRGVNVFESPKATGVPFTGFKLAFGAAFRQQYQGLEHKNTATAVTVSPAGVTPYNANQLIDITRGFNLADANLSLNMQLAEGIRVHLSSYLSSKHHQETWVKDGYAQIDKSPIDNPILNKIMQYTTLKLGHYETNFGDQHFRRSDNGMGLYNPFVGNLIIDAFTTEVGGEVYVRPGPFLAMFGINTGTINGGLTTPGDRSDAYVGKLGFDKQLTPWLRTRLTGSYYKNDKSPSNTLLTGDRAGSAYDLVMENTAATTTAQAWSGNMRSINFNNSIRAVSVSPFIKFQGLEFFGVADDYKGKAFSEPGWRTWKQQSGELVYRFMDEKVFTGARINAAKGGLVNTAAINYGGKDVSMQRNALSTGWFVTPTMLLKGEYMQQKFYGFPTTDIRNGGKIQGFMVEGVVSF